MLPPINTPAYQKTENEIQGTPPPISSVTPETDVTSIRQVGQTDSTEDKDEKNRQNAQDQKSQSYNFSQLDLDELNENISRIHNMALQFSKHDKTGQTMIKVMNKDTDTLIREIPAEKILDMLAKFNEVVGVLFDTKV